MLTSDLLRATLRKGEVRPQYLDIENGDWLARATTLCALYKAGVGRTRGAIDEDLKDLVGDERSHLVTRGLAKLLEDRADFQTVSPIDPVALRAALFDRAFAPLDAAGQAAEPTAGAPRARAGLRGVIERDAVLAEQSAVLGVDVATLEAAMYGDLRSEQRMVTYEPLAPRDLLIRYNLALAQAVLYRARALRIDVVAAKPASLRAFFRALKFHQLMHRTVRISATRWQVHVDGPLSLFQQGQRYGLQMAMFLPTLLSLKQWALEADLTWGDDNREAVFRLTPEDGLVTTQRARGVWVSKEQQQLTERLQTHKNWEATEDAIVVDLGGEDVLVPDLTLVHRTDGRRLLVEVIGFWRRGYLERRLDVLQRHGPANLVLCVSRRMAAETGSLLEEGRVVPFAEVIPLPRLLEAAERLAR